MAIRCVRSSLRLIESSQAKFYGHVAITLQTKEVEEPTVQTDASGDATASAAADSAAEPAANVTSSEATGGQNEDAPVAAAAMTADQQQEHKEEIGDAVSEKKAE